MLYNEKLKDILEQTWLFDNILNKRSWVAKNRCSKFNKQNIKSITNENFVKKYEGEKVKVNGYDQDNLQRIRNYDGIIGIIDSLYENDNTTLVKIITKEKSTNSWYYTENNGTIYISPSASYAFDNKYLELLDYDNCLDCGAIGRDPCKKGCPNKV